MKTRQEVYAEMRKVRQMNGTIRYKCKGCGCYIKGRHKIWCKLKKQKEAQNK